MGAGGSAAAIGVLAGLLLAGCGTPRLAALPRPAADLSGQWILDVAASDDAARLIAAAVPVPKPRRPTTQDPADGTGIQPMRGGGGGSRGGGGRRGGRSDGGGDSQSAARAPDPTLAWGRLSPKEFVSAFVLPPERLDVVQQPALVRVGAGDRPRAFEPGDEDPVTVNDRYGSRAVRAGWVADAFMISSKDGSRLDVREQLRRNRDDRLERVVEFHAASIKTLKVRAVYRRATAADLQSGRFDGPPAPIR